VEPIITLLAGIAVLAAIAAAVFAYLDRRANSRR
jgi:hypothetical protein